MNFLSNIKSLFNQHSYTQEERFLKDKITMLNIIMLVVGTTIFAFSILRYLQGEQLQANVDMALFLTIVYSAMLLSKDKKNLIIVARILIIASTIVILLLMIRMTAVETRYLWISIVTYLMFYFLGAKEGKRWFIGLTVLVTTLFLLNIIHMSAMSFVIYLVTSSLLAFFFIKYEKIKDKSEQFFLNYTSELNKKVDEKVAELQEQKEVLESLFQKSYDGILLIENAKFVKCNDAIVKMLQYKSADELLNLHPSQLSPEFQPDGESSEDKANRMMRLCIEQGSHNFEWVHQKANGENFWSDITLTYLHLKSGNIIHTIWRDISDKKALEVENEKMYHNLESEVQKRTQELQVAMRTKSDFLANMSHEIRTPLNAILGFINILKKGEQHPTRLKHFDIIQSSSQSLLRIINDILDFSKIESNKLDIETNKFDILKTFEDTYLLFLTKASEKNITLKLNIAADTPQQVLGDIVRVKQIISNLLSNAIKFTPEDGAITINVSYTDEYLECSVIDSGIGIEASNLSKIFDSFSQADTSTTRKFGGTGLGLSISKHLAELMDGSLHATSIINEGSTFTFRIKLVKEQNQDNNVNDSTLDTEESGFNSSNKLLVVEDNKTNQMLMTILLQDLSLQCDVADNGFEAVNKVQYQEYDLILMDENMPIMNGIEATKNIRKLGFTSIPIIAVTANALKGDKEKFLDAGMNDYLSKPIDTKEFKLILNKYLN